MKGWLWGALVMLVLVFSAPYFAGLVLVTMLSPVMGCAAAVQPTGSMVAGQVRLPLVGSYRLSSPFGGRVHPVTGEYKQHNGLDLSMSPHGGPVLAMADGTVTKAGPAGAAGNRVEVDHGNGLVSKYFHLARIDVAAGQAVASGTQLGGEGATGRVTGPHLHWEVWVNGSAIDPKPWAEAHGVAFDGNAPVQSSLSLQTQLAAQSGAMSAVAVANPPAAPGAGLPTSIGAWDSEQLSNAAEIVAAGTALGLDEWTITVGVMTAMGESSLRNLDRGDAVGPDSRGLFQQRSNGAWGSYQDRMTPAVAATNFFAALTKVADYHSLSPTAAAHRTQRNADPGYYSRFWADAVLVVSTLLSDPSLATRLAASGLQSDCAAGGIGGSLAGALPGGALTGGALPGAPMTECPTVAPSTERGLQPVALRGARCAAQAFPDVHTMYGVGSRPGKSDHPRGLAVDFMIDGYRTPEGKATGYQLAEWTQAHASELGVRYIIWDMKYWSASKPDKGWVPYTRYGSNPDDNLGHRNHVHVSYNG